MRGISKIMHSHFIKKHGAIIFTIILMYSCTNAQTFVVTDIVVPDNIPEKYVQERREKIIGTEVYLLFSDNDVRMTVRPKGEKARSIILQKIGDDLYRGEDGRDVFDLELKTFFSYIKSCKVTMYDRKSSSSLMVWGGTIIVERK